VSARTLQSGFQEVFGVSPQRFLRWQRFSGARRDLLEAEHGLARVCDIASRWGFIELGRFAVEYKQLFGESPSATLRARRPMVTKRLADAIVAP
jgi:AraC family ethanolamine operon transcriptional activator